MVRRHQLLVGIRNPAAPAGHRGALPWGCFLDRELLHDLLYSLDVVLSLPRWQGPLLRGLQGKATIPCVPAEAYHANTKRYSLTIAA